MTAIASTPERAGPAARGAALLDRVLAVTPLLASYLVLALVYAWHAVSHGSPWLFSDELEYAQISRSIAETGEAAIRGQPHDWVSLYTYVLAPVWWIGDTQTAYAAAKYLGVFLMASALFPAYGLARMVAPRGLALLAAVASAAIPALAYSRLLVIEVLAYPFAALAFFVMAKALATRSRYWIAAALLAALVAPAVRSQFVILWPVLAGAASVSLWLGEPARRFRAGWSPLQWIAALVGLAVLVHIAHEQLIRRYEVYYVATTLPDRMLDFSVWAWGAFVIGIGVLPALAALVALWRPRDAADPAYAALAGLLGSSIVFFGLYTVAKTVHLSTVFADVVAERNLVYLAPLVFAATALFLHRPSGNLLVLAGAGAVVAYLMEETPYQLDRYPYYDAPSLAALAVLNREPIWLSDGNIEGLFLWIAIGCSVLIGAAAVVPRARRWLQPALVGLACTAVAWSFTGLVSFGNGINDLGNRLRGSIPNPPNWVDRTTGGKPTLYLGQAVADGNAVFLTEFWNRSVRHVGTLDDAAVGPGLTRQIVPYSRDGRVVNDPGVDYVVTNTIGVDPVGELVEQPGGWRLYRVDRPLRLDSAVTGVYVDGWTGPKAAYSFFGEGEEGVLEVVVSRVGSAHESRGEVTVRVGDLVPAPMETIVNPCAGATCVDRNPRLGEVYGVGRWTATPREQKLFRFEVRRPFRLEVTTDPPFSPFELGETDMRQLGVQIAVAFKPARD